MKLKLLYLIYYNEYLKYETKYIQYTSINVNGNLSFNGQTTAETFNKYFVSVAQNIQVNKHKPNTLSDHNIPISYLSRTFIQSFPTLNLRCVSSKEIKKQLNHLKQQTHTDMIRYQQKF
jgi:hypothetical protein